MTLLEGAIALVILGLSAMGFLDVFRSGASTAARARDVSEVVAQAESAMEAASLGDAVIAQEALGAADTLVARRVEARPWGTAPGVTELVVVVTPRHGAPFELRRLVRDPGTMGPRP
ncbi:MAG: type II secretion system protein [Gemmatimonadetes bacterium]|nr:type II secretion system protein [Gemmatimonadota bacterium]